MCLHEITKDMQRCFTAEERVSDIEDTFEQGNRHEGLELEIH